MTGVQTCALPISQSQVDGLRRANGDEYLRFGVIFQSKPGGDFPATGGEAGAKYNLKYVIDEQGLNDAVGLEKVNVFINKDGEEKVFSVEPLTMTGHEGNNYTFEATLTPRQFGQYKSAVRMYPKNPNLPHRQDFCYLKWLELPGFNN